MDSFSPPLAFAFTWRKQESSYGAVPVHARNTESGVAIQFLDGSVRLYRRDYLENNGELQHPPIQFTPVALIVGDIAQSQVISQENVSSSFFESSQMSGGPTTNITSPVTAIAVSKYATPEGTREALFVSRAGGIIRKYDIPSGKLISQCQLPFECRGFDSHINQKLLLVWGYSCKMIALNQQTLEIVTQWDSLPDWPLPTSLFEDRVLVFFKSGLTSFYKVSTDNIEKNTNVTEIKITSSGRRPSLNLPYHIHTPPLESEIHSKGHNIQEEPSPSRFIKERKPSAISFFDKMHGVDPIISVKQVSVISWVVARRHGWMVYKWENEILTEQISADVSDGIVSIISGDISKEKSLIFGILTRTGKIIWVCNGNMQIIEPIWKAEDMISAAVFNESDMILSAFVVTEFGIDNYHAVIKTSEPTVWAEKHYRLHTFKRTTEFVSSVLKDHVIFGQDNQLLSYTPSQFLQHKEKNGMFSGSIIHVLENENAVITTIKSFFSDKKIILVVGSSDGTLTILDPKKESAYSSIKLFSCPIIYISRVESPKKYDHLLIIISFNSEIAFVDVNKKKLWRNFPGHNTNIRSISFCSNMISWMVVTYENHTRKVWNIETLESIDNLTFYNTSFTPSYHTPIGVLPYINSTTTKTFGVNKSVRELKNEEVEKYENILQLRQPLLPFKSKFLIEPVINCYGSPLMVVRADNLISELEIELEERKEEGNMPITVDTALSIIKSVEIPLDYLNSNNIGDLFRILNNQAEATSPDLGIGLVSTLEEPSKNGHQNTSQSFNLGLTLYSLDRHSDVRLLEIDESISSYVIVVLVTLIQLVLKFESCSPPPVKVLYTWASHIPGIKKPSTMGLAWAVSVTSGKLFYVI